MIPAIFQPEVSSLESQVAALQAQIAAHTERITLLNDAEFVAGNSLESLRAAIQKVSSLAPSASNLRAAVLNLFSGSDDNDDTAMNRTQPHNLTINSQFGTSDLISDFHIGRNRYECQTFNGNINMCLDTCIVPRHILICPYHRTLQIRRNVNYH